VPTDKKGVNTLMLDRDNLSTGIRLVEVYDSEGKALVLLPRTHFKVVSKDGDVIVVGGQKCLEISFTSPDGKATHAYMPRTLVREYGLNGFRLDFPFLPGLASQELTGIAYGGDKLPYYTSVDPNTKNQELAKLGEDIIPFPKGMLEGQVVRRCKKCNGKRSLHRVYETKGVKQHVLGLHKLLTIFRLKEAIPFDVDVAIVKSPKLKLLNIDEQSARQFLDYRDMFICNKAPQAMIGVVLAKVGESTRHVAAFSTGTEAKEDKFQVSLQTKNTARINSAKKLGIDLQKNKLYLAINERFGGCLFRFLSDLCGLEPVSVNIKPGDKLTALPQWTNNTQVQVDSVCAAVKLVQYCNENKMLPLALSEIWFGTTQTGGTGYVDGETIESCINCRKILPYMLCPVTVANFAMQVSKPDKLDPELPLPQETPNNNGFNHLKMEQ
jgi:hypothetical protein